MQFLPLRGVLARLRAAPFSSLRAVSWYRRVHRQRAGFAVVSETISHVHRH